VHGLKLLDEGANAEKQMSMNKRTRKKLCCKRQCLGRACRHCLRLESLRRVGRTARLARRPLSRRSPSKDASAGRAGWLARRWRRRWRPIRTSAVGPVRPDRASDGA